MFQSFSKIKAALSHYITPFLVVVCLAAGFRLVWTGFRPTEKTPDGSRFAIQMQVDSFVRYPFGRELQFNPHGYLFSPFEPDKIWFFPFDAPPFELDLAAHLKTQLSEKLNAPFLSGNAQGMRAMKDPFDNNRCWFLQRERDLWAYDHSTGKGVFLDQITKAHQDVLTVAFSADFAWVGASEGLWMYDRHSGILTPVEGSPKSAAVLVEADAAGIVWVNRQYKYTPATKQWEKLAEYPTKTVDQPTRIPVFEIETDDGETYASTFSHGANWYFNSHYWLSKDSREQDFRYYKPIVPGFVQELAADDRYLYVLLNKSFLIVNQDWLNKNRGPLPASIAEMRRLEFLADSLKVYGVDGSPDKWYRHLPKIAFIRSIFHGEINPAVLQKIDQIARGFDIPERRDSLMSILARPGLDTSVMHALYYNLIKRDVSRGALKSALEAIAVYKAKAPNAGYFQKHAEGVRSLNTVISRFDSLEKAMSTPDELLWHKGQVMELLCRSSGMLTEEEEPCYDFSPADTMYNRLIRLFPRSPRAEDADYQLIILRFCEEGSDGRNEPDVRTAWKNYLKKYPDGKRNAEALCHMAWASGTTKSELRQAVAWLAEAKQLRPDLFDQNIKGNNLWMRQQLQEELQLVTASPK
jgi:hypothetical protein